MVFGFRSLLTAAGLALLFTSHNAYAASAKVSALADKLKDSDFRVRTSAALALGASKDADAVTPLCGVLNDDNDVVRQSSAAALKKLADPSGIDCLERRLPSESAASVKKQIEVSLTFLRAAPEPENPNAKFYVAIGAVSAASELDKATVEAAIRGTARGRLRKYGTFQLAPKSESTAQATAQIKKRKLKGFYLTVSVKTSKSGGGTRFSTSVAMFTYPAKSLKGTVSGAAVSSTPSMDDQALSMAFEGALESFADNASAL